MRRNASRVIQKNSLMTHHHCHSKIGNAALETPITLRLASPLANGLLLRSSLFSSQGVDVSFEFGTEGSASIGMKSELSFGLLMY